MDKTVVNKDSDIIKVLREEEKQGLLTSSIQNYKEEPVSQQKMSDEESTQTVAFLNEEDTVETDFNEKIPDDVESLKKEVLELRKKLKESHERYNSLVEYFEIISDTTIALGT